MAFYSMLCVVYTRSGSLVDTLKKQYHHYMLLHCATKNYLIMGDNLPCRAILFIENYSIMEGNILHCATLFIENYSIMEDNFCLIIGDTLATIMLISASE